MNSNFKQIKISQVPNNNHYICSKSAYKQRKSNKNNNLKKNFRYKSRPILFFLVMLFNTFHPDNFHQNNFLLVKKYFDNSNDIKLTKWIYYEALNELKAFYHQLIPDKKSILFAPLLKSSLDIANIPVTDEFLLFFKDINIHMFSFLQNYNQSFFDIINTMDDNFARNHFLEIIDLTITTSFHLFPMEDDNLLNELQFISTSLKNIYDSSFCPFFN